MELPRILRKRFNNETHGTIELCPDEYNLDTLSAQIEAALVACEELALESTLGVKAAAKQK